MAAFVESFKVHWNVFSHGFICTFAVYKLGSHREKHREKHLWMRGVHVILKN